MQLNDAQMVVNYLKIVYKEHYHEGHEEVSKKNIKPIRSRIPLPPTMPTKFRKAPLEAKEPKMHYSGGDDSYNEIRAKEKEYCDQMRFHFKMAAKAHQRGDGATAKRESQQGKYYKQMYLVEKRLNVERTMYSKNQGYLKNEQIDLHGLHEDEVWEVLDKYVREIKDKINTGEIGYNRGAHRGHCITIITGKGNNSRMFRPVIKAVVRDYLKSNGIGFKEGDGYVTANIV